MKKRTAQELKDLDVDRVDGVDKPATGRRFLLFKSEDGAVEVPDHVVGKREGSMWSDLVFGGRESHSGGRVVKRKGFENTIRKDAPSGDFYGREEFDITEFGDRQPAAAEPPVSGFDAVSTRLGSMRVLRQLPYTVRTFDVPVGAAAPDPFLRGESGPYIGGRDATHRGDFVAQGDVAGKYRFAEPDADRRGRLNFADATEDVEDLFRPAGFEPPEPGNVGGVPVQVRKRLTRTGTFTSAILGRHGDAADSFLA